MQVLFWVWTSSSIFCRCIYRARTIQERVATTSHRLTTATSAYQYHDARTENIHSIRLRETNHTARARVRFRFEYGNQSI